MTSNGELTERLSNGRAEPGDDRDDRQTDPATRVQTRYALFPKERADGVTSRAMVHAKCTHTILKRVARSDGIVHRSEHGPEAGGDRRASDGCSREARKRLAWCKRETE